MANLDQEFIEGYRDGYDLDAPIPNDNRSAAYKHSFAIGRAEKEGKPTPGYWESMARVKEIKAMEIEV